MNPGDSVQDVSRTGPDEASGLGAAAGQGSGTIARSPRTEKPLQDIQDIIDKLAAVNPAAAAPEEQRGQPVELDRQTPSDSDRSLSRRALSAALSAAARSRANARM